MEYEPFVRAFESIIGSKTSSSSERLYYLEHFTGGDVRELVRSFHYLPPKNGYQEAQRLIRKKFGDNYHVAAAYETKTLNLPNVKVEDGQALSRFAIFLMRCKNAMQISRNLTKLEQPETIKKLSLKLPFSLRVRWRRLLDEIMEDQGRAIRFNDLAEFVDHEARVATNPLFGKIVEDSRPRPDTRRDLLNKGSHEKTKERQAKEVKNLDLSKENLPFERALGVRWCIETDTFGFKIDLKHSPPTRRGILSVLSSVYDPLDLAAPFVLPAQRLLQDLCREKLGCDDAIPSKYEVSWERWLADVPKLSKFSVERYLKPDGFGVITSSQLHHFADASEIGNGSVSYLRLVNAHNEAHCFFLCAKSRVTPSKMITIPRLELSAAVTAVKQDRLLKRELEISVNARSVFWTDSTAVLRYVKNETNRYHNFVANRVAIIRDGSQPNQWFHVNGDNNPADDASRGLTADIFLRQSRWLTGPASLWKHDSMWPAQDQLFGEIANNDPEVKREVRAGVSSLSIPKSPLLQYASRCSSWSLLVKVVAWLFRYRDNLLKASKGDKPRNGSLMLITLKEIQRAEGEILKHVQRQSFLEETANPKKQVKKSSRLYN
ncbi:uncharacterized protein [Montipora foliosa]|uniref:uncharacterized protein n=1 Tax=Montipora foliosa TaxID=591990 RepID=UPI0035F1C1E3